MWSIITQQYWLWLTLPLPSDVEASLTGVTYTWQLHDLITRGALMDHHQISLEVTEDVTGEWQKKLEEKKGDKISGVNVWEW